MSKLGFGMFGFCGTPRGSVAHYAGPINFCQSKKSPTRFSFRSNSSSGGILSPPIEFRIRKDYICRFFSDHVHRAYDKEAGNARKHRSVDHAQPCCAMHPKVAAQHAILLARADGAAA